MTSSPIPGINPIQAIKVVIYGEAVWPPSSHDAVDFEYDLPFVARHGASFDPGVVGLPVRPKQHPTMYKIR